MHLPMSAIGLLVPSNLVPVISVHKMPENKPQTQQFHDGAQPAGTGCLFEAAVI